MQLALGVILVLLVALVACIVWLSNSRKDEVQAEAESKALKRAQERKKLSDAIMSEPTAFEPDWIRAARERAQRLRQRDRQP